MRIIRKINSIYAQLLQLIVCSAIISFIIFGLLNYIGEFCLDFYLDNTNYIEKENEKYVNKIQEYVNENKISTNELNKLNKWIEKQKILSIKVYKKDSQIYDSQYNGNEIIDENYTWERCNSIKFFDEYAKVIVVGAYSYRLYNCTLIAEICVSFIIFITIILMGIRKKIMYILKLCNEIEILEGGNLDYSITIEGKDEISMMAVGLNNMRISLKKLINKEKEMIQENQRIVTEMSHDLRTPVTAIMLYTEILKKGKYKHEEQIKEYIDRIDQKAHRMKQLTDNLFEYSLIEGEEDVNLEDPELYEVVFYDIFSETCNYLQQNGINVIFNVEWIERKICISTEYIMRIMDNITSNILKYADKAYPVKIYSEITANKIKFIFENKIADLEEKVESTGIGLRNIKKMMKYMEGGCTIKINNKESFLLTLEFPCYDKMEVIKVLK